MYVGTIAFIRSLVTDQYSGISVDGHNTKGIIVHGIRTFSE